MFTFSNIWGRKSDKATTQESYWMRRFTDKKGRGKNCSLACVDAFHKRV